MTAAALDDDAVPLEKDPHDVLPMDSVKLVFEDMSEVVAMGKGRTDGEKQCHVTEDELFACFRKWTTCLSEVHQSQLDKACQKIIQDLTEIFPRGLKSGFRCSTNSKTSMDSKTFGFALSAQRSPIQNPDIITGGSTAPPQHMLMATELSRQQESINSITKKFTRSKTDGLSFSVQSSSTQRPATNDKSKIKASMRQSGSNANASVQQIGVAKLSAFADGKSRASRHSSFVEVKSQSSIEEASKARQHSVRPSFEGIQLPKRVWYQSILPNRSTLNWRKSLRFVDDADREPSMFERFVISKGFDSISALLIIAFLVTLGMETNHMSQNSGKNSSMHLGASLAFNIWFTLELVLRIAAERSRYFYSEDWKMNLLDFLLVVNSLVEMVMAVLVKGQESGLENLRVGRIMRIVRILRVVRIVRLVRALRHIYQFRKMVCLIQGCVMTLFWVLAILTCIVYTFAVFFTQGAVDHLFQNTSAEEVPDSLAIRQYYGSVSITMNSLFMSMSNGIGWQDAFQPLGSMGWIYSASFLLFITSMVFGTLNVITSVFVESTMKSALAYRDLIITDNEQTRQVALEHLKKVFKEIDDDGNGVVTLEEMNLFIQDANMEAYMHALEIDLHDVRHLFLMLDSDQSGKVDIDEFCEGCLKLKGEAKSFDVHRLLRELAKHCKRWSNFTQYVAHRFDMIEAGLQASLHVGASAVRPGRIKL